MKTCIITCLLPLCLAGCPSSTSTPSATGGSAGGGAGGGRSGPCEANEVPVQQLISTEVECKLSALPTQCAGVCDLQCANNDFDLGAVGSGCAMDSENTAYCRCVCAYCRVR
jgi:hypothetical protein